MDVLDGYEVQIFPGDKYANAHLFVRGAYVHKIVVTDTAVLLADSGVFDGQRTVFTPEESADLRTWSMAIQAEETKRDFEKKAAQKVQAQRIRALTATKLAGMESTQIFD